MGAPPPEPIAPEPENPFVALKSFIARMQSAAAVFRAEPKEVELGERVQVALTVSPGSSPEDLLQREHDPNAAVAAGATKIAPRMRAELIVPEDVETVRVGSEDRAIHDEEDTVWEWTVTPVEEGNLSIRVRLTAPVIIEGKETPYDIRTFDATVNVFVRPTTRILSFLSNNWQWLWTTLVVPVFVWRWSKKPAKTYAKK